MSGTLRVTVASSRESEEEAAGEEEEGLEALVVQVELRVRYSSSVQ